MVSAISLLVICYLPNDARILSVMMLIIPLSATAFQYGGSYINHVDLSPNYAGIIIAISNSIPNLCSIFGPIFVQFVVTDEVSFSTPRSLLDYYFTALFETRLCSLHYHSFLPCFFWSPFSHNTKFWSWHVLDSNRDLLYGNRAFAPAITQCDYIFEICTAVRS